MNEEQASFSVAVPFPELASAFQIKHEQQVLHTVRVSSHSPSLSIVSLSTGGGDQLNLTWQASDRDGDTLYHSIEYSHNNRNWFVLASTITETHLVYSLEELAGSGQARVRLTTAATQAEASVHHRRQHDLVECNCACK